MAELVYTDRYTPTGACPLRQNIIADVFEEVAAIKEQPKKNRRDTIIKGFQDSYSKSGEPVDAKATVANAQDKAEELKDKILESLKLND